jgi:hypothetical protein
VKTTIIALSAAASSLLAVDAHSVSSKPPGQQHKVSKKHHPGVSDYAPMSSQGPRQQANQASHHRG